MSGKNPDIPGAGRVGVPGRAAGWGLPRLNANRIICPGNKSLFASKNRIKMSFQRLSRSTRKKKPIEKQNLLFTTSLSSVYQQVITGTKGADCFWLPKCEITVCCRCKPFSCKACPAIRLQNLPIPKHGHTTGGLRWGARQGGGAGSDRTVAK